VAPEDAALACEVCGTASHVSAMRMAQVQPFVCFPQPFLGLSAAPDRRKRSFA
jgi:hypothetical protein